MVSIVVRVSGFRKKARSPRCTSARKRSMWPRTVCSTSPAVRSFSEPDAMAPAAAGNALGCAESTCAKVCSQNQCAWHAIESSKENLLLVVQHKIGVKSTVVELHEQQAEECRG